MTIEKSMKGLNAGVVLQLILVLVIASSAALGQAAGAGELAANNVVTQSPKAMGGVTLSQDTLQARVEAQQQEIDELKALVKKLQVMVEPQASIQPVVATSAFSVASARAMAVGAARGSSAPEPSPSPTTAMFSTPRELLPDIGQIGAEVGLLVGGSQNPYKADKGFFGGGYIDLPLKRLPGGKLSYEIMISLQRTTTTAQTTSGVTALANAVANVELGTAPSLNNLFSPLPVTTSVIERSTVLTVAPVELKYTATTMGRFRPYAVVGLGTYTSLSSQNNAKFFDAASIPAVSAVPGLAPLLNSLLQGSQVAGLAPEAPELRARGVAPGQGDMRFGLQYGGGMEFRVSPRYSIGFDYRQNKVEGTNAGFGSFTFKQAIHF